MAHAKRASRRNGRRLGAAAGMSLAMGAASCCCADNECTVGRHRAASRDYTR